MSLKRLSRPVFWLTTNAVAEVNLAANILPRLSKLSLPGVRINSCEPNRLLLIDEDIGARHPQIDAEDSVFRTKCEARVQPHIFATIHDVRVHDLSVLVLKHEARVWSQAALKCEVRVSLQEREICVQPKHDLRVFILKRESRVQLTVKM